jgi:hypothetical protein
MDEGMTGYVWWLCGIIREYLDLLTREQIRLSEPVMVASVLADLCRMAGVPEPPDVACTLEVKRQQEMAQRVVAGGIAL